MDKENLEHKVEGFWTPKFKKFDEMDIDGIRTYMLDALNYLKDNMATPDVWLNHPEQVPKEAVEKIDELNFAHTYLLQNPKKFEALYKLVTNHEAIDREGKNESSYVRFVYQVIANTNIMPPGEKMIIDGRFVWCLGVRDKIRFGIYNLEIGPTNDYWTKIDSQFEILMQKTKLEASR